MRSPSLVRKQGLILFTILVSFWLMCGSAPAQIVSTWSGGAGNWSDCPPSGNALWDTCPDPPNGKGWPNGNFDAVINGGPVNATSASIVNLTIGSGGSLVFQSGVPGIVDITGTSIKRLAFPQEQECGRRHPLPISRNGLRRNCSTGFLADILHSIPL